MEGKFIIFAVFAVLAQNLFAVSGDSTEAIESAISTTVEFYTAANDIIFEAITTLEKDRTTLTDHQFEEAESKSNLYFKSGTYSFLKLDESLAELADSIYSCIDKFDKNVYGAMKAVSSGERDIEAYESEVNEAISGFVGIPFRALLNLDLDNDTRAQIVNLRAKAETIIGDFGDNIMGAIRILPDGSNGTKVTDLWRNASLNIVDFGKLLSTLFKLLL